MTPNRTRVAPRSLVVLFVWVIVGMLSSPLFAEEHKAWRSWQIDNPAWAGMLSAASLGLWPAQFGNDVEAVPIIRIESIADGALPYSRAHAERAFRFWRGLTFTALLGALIAGLFQWRRRHSRRAAAASSPAP